MKLPLILASLALAASSASASVTLQFNTASGSLQNFANTAGVGGSAMVWGIIIDAADNGFSYAVPGTFYASSGLTFTPGALQSLFLSGGGATDDVLFLASNLMNVQSSEVDGMPAGTNRVTSIAAVPFGSSGISAGDPFAVVWFGSTNAPNGAPIGFGRFGAVNNPGLQIPADGSTTPFASLFAGPDPLKGMNYLFDFPEPSTTLLGMLGALTLLRRRREA
jgi:hypothetical protein